MTLGLRRTGRVLVIPGLLGLAAVGCAGAPSPLDPRTAATARIAELGGILIALAIAVCVVVCAALFAALVVGHRRARRVEAPASMAELAAEQDDRVVVIGGMVLPSIVIAFTLAYTIYTLREVAGIGGPGRGTEASAHAGHRVARPEEQVSAGAAQLAVQVTGKQWWWQVRYPDEQVVTANEIHVPVGVPIRLTVSSDDVIHSFWIPQVAGKVDLIPGKANTITFQVEQTGVFRGLCSEVCGIQHARMHLLLIVDAPTDFASWLARQQRPPPAPADPLSAQGQQLFLRSCAECHAVQGTGAAGSAGPDLTHVATRQTLGAGMHENTRANLVSWTADAQAMKPGNRMPSFDLDEAQLRAVVTYLERLE
jgi:cytochrome c oxidase subunit 2